MKEQTPQELFDNLEDHIYQVEENLGEFLGKMSKIKYRVESMEQKQKVTVGVSINKSDPIVDLLEGVKIKVVVSTPEISAIADEMDGLMALDSAVENKIGTSDGAGYEFRSIHNVGGAYN